MKHTRKLLALLVALLLVLSAVPVASAAGDPRAAGETITEAYLSKHYNTAVDKDFTFEFQAEQIKDGEGVVTEDATLTIDPIEFTDPSLTETNKQTSKLNFDTFPAAGHYIFKVTETGVTGGFSNTEYEKLIMSKAEYRVHVYVAEEEGQFVIKSITIDKIKDDAGEDVVEGTKVTDAGEDPTTNTFTFTNTYVYEAGHDGDPEDPKPDDYNTFGSLYIKKNVENKNEGGPDTQKDFSFTATFTFPAGTDEKTLDASANGEPITGKTHTFTLKHGESIKFTGLPVGTKIKLVEAGSPNYAGTAVVNFGSNRAESFGSSTAYNKELTVEPTVSLTENTNKAVVTNTYVYTPPIGVILNVLPFAVMLALAGGALALFLVLKRRNGDEEA